MLEGIHLHLLQSRIILDLEIMKKNIPKLKFYSSRLCHCKKVIFENYINAHQIVLIRLCSKLYKYYEDIYFNNKDKSELKSYLSSKDLEKIFEYYSFRVLLKEEYISKKMLCMFYETQDKTNAKFFDYLNDSYLDLVDAIYNDDLFLTTYNIFTEYLKNHIETFTFNLVGFNIDCCNISNDIVLKQIEDYNVDSDFCVDKCFVCRNESSCWKKIYSVANYNINESEGCIVHNNIKKIGDFIHLIFFEEHITSNCIYFKNYLVKICNYHKDPSKISLIFDFKLVKNDDVYEDVLENADECFTDLLDKFGTIYIFHDDDKIFSKMKSDKVVKHDDFIKTELYKVFFEEHMNACSQNKESVENTCSL